MLPTLAISQRDVSLGAIYYIVQTDLDEDRSFVASLN
jgi:hypothetical protein